MKHLNYLSKITAFELARPFLGRWSQITLRCLIFTWKRMAVCLVRFGLPKRKSVRRSSPVSVSEDALLPVLTDNLWQSDQLVGLLFSLITSRANLLGMLRELATRNDGRRTTRRANFRSGKSAVSSVGRESSGGLSMAT